ncbi:MAG: ATP-grasp domain-containing protein [Planctomycetota bacterium]|nr:ATP-grasp domain-containing protein [Planctomycetota bacterium]
MRVGFAYNLKGQLPTGKPPDHFAEFDDPQTIDAIRNVLQERHDVFPIEVREDAYARIVESRSDIIFNLAEGLHGSAREAQIPAILEMLQIPYTGSDPVTLAISLDKRRTREVLMANGVPTPRQVVVDSVEGVGAARRELNASVAIIKPVAEGSSKGIPDASVVEEDEQWRVAVGKVLDVYRQAAVAEEFLPGREFTVAILGNGAEARAFPTVEINLSILPNGLKPIYSYEAKWVVDRPENPIDIFTCPADIPPELDREVQTVALDAYRVLDCRDWSRVDVRLDATGRPRIIELNPLPGILPNPEENSCYPKAARAGGLSYSEMIHAVLDAACKRVGLS